MSETGFRDGLKRNFLTGLAALFPILVTIMVFVWLYGYMDATVGRAANSFFQETITRNKQMFRFVFPDAEPEVVAQVQRRRDYAAEHFPRSVGVLLGLALLVVLVYLLGRFLRGYIGERLIGYVDRFFTRFPVIKSVYPHARNVADFLFGQRQRRKFSDVVAVQYPLEGTYSLGFVTSDGLEAVSERLDQEMLTVFVPNSPAPLTGFTLLVPQDEVISLQITVDEAFRFFITAGVLTSNGPVVGGGGMNELPTGTAQRVEEG